MNWGTLLFSGRGRINRAKYWLVGLIGAVVLLFVVLAVPPDGDWSLVIFIPTCIFVIVISLVNAVKRLHDRDKSGFWLLLFFGVPAFLQAAFSSGIDSSGIFLQLVSAAISIWGQIEMGFLKGTAGPNSYGADPLAEATTDAPAA